MSHEEERIRCWKQFLGAANAYLDVGELKPGRELLAEIRMRFGDEVAEQAKKELNNWIMKRKK